MKIILVCNNFNFILSGSGLSLSSYSREMDTDLQSDFTVCTEKPKNHGKLSFILPCLNQSCCFVFFLLFQLTFPYYFRITQNPPIKSGNHKK